MIMYTKQVVKKNSSSYIQQKTKNLKLLEANSKAQKEEYVLFFKAFYTPEETTIH